MAELARQDDGQRVRPVSALLAILCGIATGALYLKGYTPQFAGSGWLRLLQLLASIALLAWGIKSVVVGSKPQTTTGWKSRLMPYRIEVTQEGWIYFGIMVSVLVGALIGKSNMLLLVFGLLAGPFVLNGHVALTMLTKNQVSRQAPPRAMQGEWFSVDVALSNRRWWVASWMMVVEDRWEKEDDQVQPIIVFSRVAPRQERIGRYQVRLNRRGRYHSGPIRLLTRFPLGLVERSYVIQNPGEILIYPQVGRLTSKWLREQPHADELVQLAKSRSGPYEDEFHRMREYRQGDSLRSIHWRTTARRNQLMVRENHQMRDTDLAIVVDLWLPESATPRQRENVELTLRFAATLCLEHSRKSRESTVFIGIAGDVERHWTGAVSPLTMPLIFDQLALAEPSSTPKLAKLATACYQFRSPAAQRVLLTTRPDLASQTITAVTSESARQGMPFRTLAVNTESLAPYFNDSPAEIH